MYSTAGFREMGDGRWEMEMGDGRTSHSEAMVREVRCSRVDLEEAIHATFGPERTSHHLSRPEGDSDETKFRYGEAKSRTHRLQR
jgi:hypothetical protein